MVCTVVWASKVLLPQCRADVGCFLLRVSGGKVFVMCSCTCCASTVTLTPLSSHTYVSPQSTLAHLQTLTLHPPFPLSSAPCSSWYLASLALPLPFHPPIHVPAPFFYLSLLPSIAPLRFNEVCSCVIFLRSGPLTSPLWLRCVLQQRAIVLRILRWSLPGTSTHLQPTMIPLFTLHTHTHTHRITHVNSSRTRRHAGERPLWQHF